MLLQLATEEANSVYYPVVQEHILQASGMASYLDRLYFGWRLYTVAWQGQFEGAKRRLTQILEACAKVLTTCYGCGTPHLNIPAC